MAGDAGGSSAAAGAHSNHSPGGEEEWQAGSMQAWEAGAVPGMLPAVLQEAAPRQGFTQLDGAGSICSSLQRQQQMPPRLQWLRTAVFPGEECCQAE